MVHVSSSVVSVVSTVSIVWGGSSESEKDGLDESKSGICKSSGKEDHLFERNRTKWGNRGSRRRGGLGSRLVSFSSWAILRLGALNQKRGLPTTSLPNSFGKDCARRKQGVCAEVDFDVFDVCILKLFVCFDL
jgi:hypothetical protein